MLTIPIATLRKNDTHKICPLLACLWSILLVDLTCGLYLNEGPERGSMETRTGKNLALEIVYWEWNHWIQYKSAWQKSTMHKDGERLETIFLGKVIKYSHFIFQTKLDFSCF